LELRTVEFYNFGPFRGLHKLNVDPKPGLENRPLTLVRANNDIGKSSILKAFNFCLYGFGSQYSSSSITERARAINRQAAFEKDGQMYVKIKFRSEGDDFTIRRTINFKKVKSFAEQPTVDNYTCDISKNENVLIDRDTNPQGFWDEVNDFIENILPKDISQFFFFDGEQIRNYAHEKPQPAITTAVQKILGIKQILNAKEDAGKNLPELKNKLTEAQIEDTENKVQGLKLRDEENANEKLQKEIDDDLATITSLEENIKNNSRILDGASGIKDDWKRRKELDKTIDDLEMEGTAVKNEGKKFNEEKLLSYLLTMKFTSSEEEQTPNHVSTTSKWCLDRNRCLCERDITPDISDHLQEISLTASHNKTRAENMIFSIIRNKYGKTLPSTLQNIAVKASNLDEEMQVNTAALDKIIEKIGDATEYEDAKIKQAEADYESDKTKRDKLEVKIEQKREKYTKEKRRLERENEELTSHSKSNKVRTAQANVVMCKQVIAALDEIIKKQIESEREDIQKRMSEYFLSITNKPKVYKEVLLDKDYRIQIRMLAGIVDVWKLGPSSGASAMISFAFIAALNSKAAKKGPIVIDTPTGRLDPIHKRNIINFWPTFGDQVIILYQPDEISDETIVDLEELTAYHYECKSKSGAEEESYLTPFGDEH
jgi:DNA sulfur modification protein DndD